MTRSMSIAFTHSLFSANTDAWLWRKDTTQLVQQIMHTKQGTEMTVCIPQTSYRIASNFYRVKTLFADNEFITCTVLRAFW